MTMQPMTLAQMQAMAAAMMQAVPGGVAPAVRGLISPEMAARMTPEHQRQMALMTAQQVVEMAATHARLPMDAMGKTFTAKTPCLVQQPVAGAGLPTVPPSLVGAACAVVSTAGERVRVRYPNGEERDFHKSELGVQ